MTKTNAQFADSYEGCQVVANIMGLNVETVRKRAKAGKIPARQNDRGTWVFDHAELVQAGIAPFATHGLIAGGGPRPVVARTNITDVFFVLDRSGSMSGFEQSVQSSLNDQVAQLRKASGPRDLYNVSIINFDTEIDVTSRNTPVAGIGDAGSLYLRPRGGTALYDALAEAISLARLADDGTHAVLISVLTDGAENASRKVSQETLADTVRSLTATDRYTFTYAGPGGSQATARALSIPSGNVTTWEQTQAGFSALTGTHHASLNTYTESRSRGVMKSTSFYAQPVTGDAAKFAAKLDDKLDDVTGKVTVERVVQGDPLKIKDFSERKFGGFEKGSLYYELTESEKVQDYKGIVVQDKTKGQFFSGWGAAKKLLGLPDFQGTVNIKPGSLGDFKVFVQSTSLNRLLTPGTAVVKLGA
jgi:uncharacterized protein YegL